MIKSKNFWIGILHLAVIPVLLVDVMKHYINWHKEVRGEIVAVVQNLYSFDKQEKFEILDRAFEQNANLTFLIYIKLFVSFVLLALGIYYFRNKVKHI